MKIFKRPGSSNYHYRVYKDGKDTWRSTKTSNRKKAIAIARNHRDAIGTGLTVDQVFSILMGKLALLPESERNKMRLDFGARLLRLKESNLPITKAWETWLSSPQKGNPSPATIAGYEGIFKRFERWIDEKKVEYLHEVTRQHANDYLKHLWSGGITARTYNAHLKFLRSAIGALKAEAGITTNPFDEMKVMAQEVKGRMNFTSAELKALCNAAQGDWRYMVAIGLFTAFRLVDVIHLRWEQIGDAHITIVPRKTKRMNKTVTVDIHPALAALLDELRNLRKNPTKGFLFPEVVAEYAKDRGKPATDFAALLATCKIETTTDIEEGEHRKRRPVIKGFHSLRHSFVSLLAAKGVPESVIREMVGHGSPAMTAIYTHTSASQRKRAIKNLPKLMGAK